MSASFTSNSKFNPFLQAGVQTSLSTILNVTSIIGATGVVAAAKKAIALLIDNSCSMDGKKIRQAIAATNDALDCLDESCYFCVITFNSSAHIIVPIQQATRGNIEAAKRIVSRIEADGGTAMSTALTGALQQFNKVDGAINFGLLLTDGENGESESTLDRALSMCEGKFRCDCYGVGTDWKPKDLRRISNRLIGKADAIPDPSKLQDMFRAAIGEVMTKGVANVRLRLLVPKMCSVKGIAQAFPSNQDLFPLVNRINDMTIEIPIGAWADDETRVYHLSLGFAPQDNGVQLMLCRPKIVFDQNGKEVICDGQNIAVQFSSMEAQYSVIDPDVAHYTGQEELAKSIRDGLAAKAQGDTAQATILLGRAAQLAAESGNEDVTIRLSKVVDIVDAEQGTVRLKAANKAADLELDMGSENTVRISRK